MCAKNIVRRTSRENEELFSGDMSKGRDVCLEVLGKDYVARFDQYIFLMTTMFRAHPQRERGRANPSAMTE